MQYVSIKYEITAVHVQQKHLKYKNKVKDVLPELQVCVLLPPPLLSPLCPAASSPSSLHLSNMD